MKTMIWTHQKERVPETRLVDALLQFQSPLQEELGCSPAQ